MKRTNTKRNTANRAALAAALLFAFIAAGCGGGKSSPAAPPEAVSLNADASIFSPDGSLLPTNDIPGDGAQPAPAGQPIRQTFRNVGASGCTAYRSFSSSTIISGGDVVVTFVLTGCAVALESLVFSDNIPSNLTVSTARVEYKPAAGASTTVAYTYEPAVAPTNYQHWYLDDVPTDGAAELPAGATLVITYTITDDGTHAAGYTYNFPLFLWAGHEPPAPSLNHDWGYADAAVTITVGVPPAGASGGLDNSACCYTPDRAFDGDYTKQWAGKENIGTWNLYYGFPAVQHLDYVFINYFSANFTPTTTAVYYSSDGVSWTFAGNMPAGSKPEMNINANMKYLRFRMTGTPAGKYPIIRDIDWLPVTESSTSTGGRNFGPSDNADFYFPSNAFDNISTSWWVGTTGPGPWDLYYNFSTSTVVNQTTITYYNVAYFPTTTTLEYGSNGSAWTSAGTFPSAFITTLTVAKKTQYLHYALSGAPPIGYPLIKDITFSSPNGASGGISMAGYSPTRAFDGSNATVWIGNPGEGQWFLFYGYAAPFLFNTAQVFYNTPNDVPNTTKIYLSTNGYTWVYWGTMPAGVINPSLLVNRTVRFIAFEMTGTPTNGRPAVKEITY